MAKVKAIGEPENRSEAKAIRYLAESLPDSYFVLHNFEVTTGHGLPYEYDVVVIGDFAVWHVEVKGYQGVIRGNQHQWEFENGGTAPSPIPLANKKSKILASKLIRHAPALRDVWVDTAILLTDDRARINVADDQASRIIQLKDTLDRFTEPHYLPIKPKSIEALKPTVFEALSGMAPSQNVRRIGLYDIIERLRQDEWRTTFLAKHRYIRTQPKTVLKVFHFDMYASKQERERQIQAIFHDQNALRLMSTHPNVLATGDMFAWDDNQFVLPVEYVDEGRALRDALVAGREKEVPWSTKTTGIVNTAHGLRHAHRHGVIHRDLRPRNIIVAPPHTLRIVNFDLALIKSNPDLVRPRHFMKRIDRRYVAPEVFRDPDSATEASDVYSMGIIIYEIITSRWPYDDIEAVMSAGDETPLDQELLMAELSTPGSEDYMGAPADAAMVINKMCRQDPAARYQTMDEVIEDWTILQDE